MVHQSELEMVLAFTSIGSKHADKPDMRKLQVACFLVGWTGRNYKTICWKV